MSGYYKMRSTTTTNSRSMDFSNPYSSPPTNTQHPSIEVDPPGERFGVILNRNCSASTTTTTSQRSSNTPHERTSNTSGNGGGGSIHAAVMRAFSMRKTSSGGEGYCRIHDQSELMQQPSFDDGGADDGVIAPPMKRRGKIIRACKWIFGF
ncbi:hypothetical protein QJS10_CPB19g00080 [Acorus calamus]|uniref:Uncharacterized protein n=1 Tax=Acorus calamus TaxID=4465 RepID=A0AAV9CJ55_ACOCL|nr:hypothetical protein QJS10_CPB19g00080 [Acorus calamus]